jgi:hypothetical protein
MTQLDDIRNWETTFTAQPDTDNNPALAAAVGFIVRGLTGQLTNSATDKDGNPVMIAAFRTAGLPAEMAESVNTAATILAESIVKAMAAELVFVSNSEHAQLQQAKQDVADTPPRTITFTCPHDQPIVTVAGNRPRVRLNMAAQKSFAAGASDCSQCAPS